MDLGIAGKWAWVCGASRGLGYGCAEALVREGVNVVIVARGMDALTQAAEKLRTVAPVGTQVRAVAADITTEAGRQALYACEDGPGLDVDIVVTNAGGPPPGDFRDWDEGDWHAAVNANMLAPIALIQATVDGMAERRFGRIVNITSSTVKAPISNLGLSNGARSGLTGFVAGLARGDIAARGVTVNNLLPGAFETERLQTVLNDVATSTGVALEDVATERASRIPARRFGQASEFGAICAFLCSQQASYITGQNILPDGGAYPGTF